MHMTYHIWLYTAIRPELVTQQGDRYAIDEYISPSIVVEDDTSAELGGRNLTTSTLMIEAGGILYSAEYGLYSVEYRPYSLQQIYIGMLSTAFC